MRKIYLILLAFLLITTNNYSQNKAKQPKDKPSIALLGIFHFAGTRDLISIKADDLTSEKRQKEIKTLVELLSKYKPTKILVEFPYGDNETDSLYQLFLKDKHTLSIHECQQVGFRLAKKSQHPQIYNADHRLQLPFKELTDYLKANGKMGLLDSMVVAMKETILNISQSAYDKLTLPEYLVFLNSEESDSANKNIYLQYTNKMGENSNPVGTNLVSTWWERNFRIMHNIDQITEPGDRILLIFGQGHTAVLKDFYKSRTDITYKDINDYLKAGK